MNTRPSIETTAIDTIRMLSMDAVQAADSGHPGTPMALAPVAYCLWQWHLRFDPRDPEWPGRDRFVLSAGHASMLLYSLLHLCGVKAVDTHGAPTDQDAVSIEELQRFRQFGSRCPGHPEHGHTTGVEMTTGPLGQGVASSVGMAIAARWKQARYDQPGSSLFDSRVYVICSDGDMMEGVSSEAASLAGHLAVSNLCWIYDCNHITIEGSTSLAFSEEVASRFMAYGWNIASVMDANDLDALDAAIRDFHGCNDRPTLIIVHSHIAYGAPHKQDTSEAHGSPLGAEEIRLTKRAYGWPEESSFLVPNGVREHFADGIGVRGRRLRDEWMARFTRYRVENPELADEIERMERRELPESWDAALPAFAPDTKGIAGREASARVLNALAARIPWMLSGSADLAPSTKTSLTFDGAGTLAAGEPGGRNLHFGIREHAMTAILNGLSLSKLRPVGSTFLIFSDYARPSIRLAALMELPVVIVFTHDSIGVGEDGPTHQPIEHLASLRAMPGIFTFRPADANEITAAWRVIMQMRTAPAAIVLSRQALPTLDRARFGSAGGVARGAYVLADPDEGDPELLLMATGSEVALCVQVRDLLQADGVRARIVSMPCWEIFDRQPASYRDAVLPPGLVARVAVEAASPLGWAQYVGSIGEVVAMRSFGASARIGDLMTHFGFTAEKVAQVAREVLARSRG